MIWRKSCAASSDVLGSIFNNDEVGDEFIWLQDVPRKVVEGVFDDPILAVSHWWVGEPDPCNYHQVNSDTADRATGWKHINQGTRKGWGIWHSGGGGGGRA